MSIFNLRNTCI